MDSTRQQSGDFRSPERWNSAPVPERVAKRAFERATVDENGCWISDYSVASHGYAQIGWKESGRRTRMVLAHRAAWVHVNGQMPMGVTLDHICKVRRCVNPTHLRVLPNYENARRVNGMDWPMGECANGHPNSDLVTDFGVNKRGERRQRAICGRCRKIYVARNNWRTRHPGEPLPQRLWLRSETQPYVCDPDCGFEGEIYVDGSSGRCPSCNRAVSGVEA